MNPESDAYNPLLEVRRGPNEVRDVQTVADILVDPEGGLEKRNLWEKTSHALLVGAAVQPAALPIATPAGVDQGDQAGLAGVSAAPQPSEGIASSPSSTATSTGDGQC